MYYQYLNKLSDNKINTKLSQQVPATKTPKPQLNKDNFNKDNFYSSKSPQYSPKTNRKVPDLKIDYNESMFDEKNTSYYEINKSRPQTYRNRSNDDNKQINCYQQLMQRAYGKQSTSKPVIKETPINDRSKKFTNTQDSLYQIDQKVNIDLGENPFYETNKPENKFPSQCLSMHSEDNNQISIKVFPSSTKNQIENKQQKQEKQEIQLKQEKQKQIKKGAKKENPYYQQNIKSTLEQKLFDEKIESQKRSKSQQQQHIESTVLVDTDQIKKDYLNTSTSAMSPKSKPGSIHFKNDVVQIKLTRNPDRHFYDFIKEYGVIMQASSPVTTQNMSPQSTKQFQSSRDVQLMISQTPSNVLSDERNSNFDSTVFTQYFQRLNTPSSVDRKFKQQF